MFTTEQCKMMELMKLKRIKDGSVFINKGYNLIVAAAIGLTLLGVSPAYADNAVKLKVLVITTGDVTLDLGLAYIKPVLDDMGVPYDVLNASTQNLTAAMLSPASCLATAVGCVGNYNGILLTDSGMFSTFTPSEMDILHGYEINFHVREAVLSGWPGPYWDPNPPYGIYLDYGLTYSSSPAAPFNAQWAVPAANSKEVYEYVNSVNPLPITDFAFAAKPRNDGTGARDGTVPSVVPILKTPASEANPDGEALVSIIRYTIPPQTTPVREVMLSTITNASFLIHSQVLAYEMINFATQGMFVGGRKVYMAAHSDDLFIPDELWDPVTRTTNPAMTYRLNSNDINNAVAKQAAFRAAHPTAGNAFKLDFPFNGSGAVVNPAAAILIPNLLDDLVLAVVANKAHLNVQIVNLSLGHPILAPAKDDPLVQAVEKASAAGLIVVTSAGNYGQRRETGEAGYTGITSPGNAPSAITVGSANTRNTVTRDDDQVAAYSSRGPAWFDAYAKPNVVAPGHRLAADTTVSSYLFKVLASGRVKAVNGQQLLSLSGTSMAAGVTSGVVALILDAHNKAGYHHQKPLTANLVKAMLEFSAIPVAGADYLTQGAGEINAAGAIALASGISTSDSANSYWVHTVIADGALPGEVMPV